MRSTHTPTSIFVSPKFTHLYHPQNCTKSTRNSINYFDTYFDAPTKYPLTNTTNKLSDNCKITQNPTNSLKSTENITPIPTLIPTFIPNFSPYLPSKYVSTTLYPITYSPLSPILNHPSKPRFVTELIPPIPKIRTKIRPESTNPSLKTFIHPYTHFPLSSYCKAFIYSTTQSTISTSHSPITSNSPKSFHNLTQNHSQLTQTNFQIPNL